MTDGRLSMREQMACVDGDGRVRCPSCGRFAKWEQLRHSPAEVWRVGESLMRLSLAPHCVRCGDDGGDE